MQISRFTPYESLATSALAGAVGVAAYARPRDASKPAVDDAQEEGTIVDSVPPFPTPEAREMVDRAADRVHELAQQNRELHFSHDEKSNRVVIEVRDLEGNVIRTIPPARALEIMSGAEL